MQSFNFKKRYIEIKIFYTVYFISWLTATDTKGKNILFIKNRNIGSLKNTYI